MEIKTKVKNLQKLASLTLGLIPFVLPLIFWELRGSISDFANASNPAVFVGLIMLSAVFYGLDAYYSERKYNIILAVGLLFVAMWNHLPQQFYLGEYSSYFHYGGATLYFGGLTFFAIYYSNYRERIWVALFFGVGLIFLPVSYFYIPFLFYWAETYMVVLASILSYLEIIGKIE